MVPRNSIYCNLVWDTKYLEIEWVVLKTGLQLVRKGLGEHSSNSVENLFRTSAPFWGQITQNLSGLCYEA